MAGGWNLKEGTLSHNNVAVDSYWAYFNYVFSDACRKTTTYKFGLIKAILDNLFSAELTSRGMEISYERLFSKFAENYWNLIAKYNLNQLRKNGKNSVSKIERAILNVKEKQQDKGPMDFEDLSAEDQETLVINVMDDCKQFVVGAVYQDFKGDLYGFDQQENRIWIHIAAYQFMMAYKLEIEKMNYYAWAKFLDKVNEDPPAYRVIEKLESSTPQRKDLTIYREILRQEFETDTCYYCGARIRKGGAVNHVLPWSFMKSDHLWNLVLACPKCNQLKRELLPSRELLIGVIHRNQELIGRNNPLIQQEFTGYSENMMWSIWDHAAKQGYQVFQS